MSPNPHALAASRATRYSYTDVRQAVNLLVAWDVVADRWFAERLVDSWMAEDVADLVTKAHSEIARRTK